MIYSKILATGSAFPKKRLTNKDLEKIVETSDEWITERTGIKARRIANIGEGETNTQLAYEATCKALEKANLKPNDLDAIIYCTVSADHPIPSAACLLQKKLNCREIPAFDLAAACSGFVYGLQVADSFIRSGLYENVLVVGSEVLSPLINWQDRTICILFGDGAGCAIVSKSNPNEKSKIISTHLHADGKLDSLFFMEAGGSSLRITEEILKTDKHYMKMKGKEIFKEAVRTLADCAIEALEANNLTIEQIDWLIPHQANHRIIEAVAKRLQLPLEKVIINIDEYGNTSAATVPTALDQAIEQGRIKRGDLVLLDVFGAGLTYGSALLYF
jgi:3-oxoacyl-[acyl-carrier-protein] synthase-3